MKQLFLILILLVTDVAFAQPKEDDVNLSENGMPVEKDNILKSKKYFNWGTSIVKTGDGKYHLFYARWKKKYQHMGWLTHCEVAHAISDSPAGPWKYKNRALSGRRGDHWDAITAHNPKIKYFEGKYYLYYISTNMGDKAISEEELFQTAQIGGKSPNWGILRANQRTGVAVSNSINGPWKRMDQPLIEPSGPIANVTVNPAITRGKDEKYYLIVKGDKPKQNDFIRDQAIAISDTPLGPFEMQQKPVIDYVDTEDVSMWYDDSRERFYAIFHAVGFIGLVTSTNGIDWQKAAHYKQMDKVVKMKDGTLFHPDRLERPFVFIENGIPTVLSFAVRKNNESYSLFIPLNDNKK